MPKKESNNLQDYPNAGLLHPSKYVTATDLRGRDATVTIKRIEPRHEMKTDRGVDLKPVVYFGGSDKGWVLNVTCSTVIQNLYGKDPREWIGKSITLFATTCSGVGGDMVDCIRVRPEIPAPKRKKEEPPPEPTRMAEDGDQFGERRPDDDDAFSDNAMGFGEDG